MLLQVTGMKLKPLHVHGKSLFLNVNFKSNFINKD